MNDFDLRKYLAENILLKEDEGEQLSLFPPDDIKKSDDERRTIQSEKELLSQLTNKINKEVKRKYPEFTWEYTPYGELGELKKYIDWNPQRVTWNDDINGSYIQFFIQLIGEGPWSGKQKIGAYGKWQLVGTDEKNAGDFELKLSVGGYHDKDIIKMMKPLFMSLEWSDMKGVKPNNMGYTFPRIEKTPEAFVKGIYEDPILKHYSIENQWMKDDSPTTLYYPFGLAYQAYIDEFKKAKGSGGLASFFGL